MYKNKTIMEESEVNINDIIGMLLEDAYDHILKTDYTARVVKKDGIAFIITCDFRLDRINLEIENDKVVRFTFG